MSTPEFEFQLITLELSSELEDYRKSLDYAVGEEKDVVFSNSSERHAALVMSAMYNHAKTTIRIFGDTLRSELSSIDLYANSLRDAIERNVNVKVLLTAADRRNLSPLANWLISLNVNNVNVRKCVNAQKLLGNVLSNKDDSDSFNYHFTVVDGKMFRLEYDVNSFKATACYNHKPIARGLEDAFDNVFEKNDIRYDIG